MAGELFKEYEEYLERALTELGDIELGAFAKYRGQLIKKLRYDEFEPLYREYQDVTRDYYESLERGDTINDLIVKLVRECATRLVLPSPV